MDVANCYLHEQYTDVSDQRSLAKQSRYSKAIVPMKRRFNDHSSIDFEYASGGNGAAIYSELDPIISKAVQTGVTEIDVSMASITEAGAHLRYARRNPRILLAASGMPDLSDIADVTEPPSALTLEPNESMTDAKSPTKRDSTQSPSPTKSNKSFRKRLSDTIVRLLPVSSSRVEPSPIKPSSPPTPNKDSESPRERRPSISIPKSPSAARSPLPLSANSTPGLVRWSSRPSKESPFARWRPKRKSEPAPHIWTASPPRNETSSILDVTMGQSSIAPESPMHQSRPKAPTPSNWNGFHPSTPGQETVATPGDDKASLGLVKSLPEWMQHNQSPATLEKCDPSNIDFGPASPSFTNSVSWVNSPTDATENARTKIVRRRKSEPLFRNMLKTQTSRRISLSPQKSIRPDGASGALPTIDEPASPIEDVSRISEHFQDSEMLNSPATQAELLNNAVTEQAEDMDLSTISSQYKKKLQATSRSSPRNRSSINPDDVFHVDMHRDQDIFGASKPAAPATQAVEQLGQIAESRCNGLASVAIGKWNGRLIVRFKLPTKYASMFPENQGGDESSHFSSSPSAISRSPRLRFSATLPADDTDYDSLDEEPRLRASENEESCLEASDETLVVSDFGSSPVKRKSSSPYQGIISTSPASTLQNSDNASISFPDITYAPDGETTIPGYADSSPAKASKSIVNPDSSSLSELEQTPSLNRSAELSITNMAVANGEGEQSANMHATPSLADSTALNAPATSPTLSLSFTPVNQAGAQKNSTASSTRSTKLGVYDSPELGKIYPIPSISHNDTPERDFLRDFIKRSKPRRTSTTDTGSPIAPAQRLPLGARSPNMETQQKEKRKFDSSEGEENESETKPEPAAKRIRRIPRATPRKSKSVVVADDHSDDEDPLAKDVTPTSVKTSDNADELANAEEQEETPSAAISRRSSRLRTKPGAIPKSSIPGPTKVGRGRPPSSSTLGSVRTEQQDLVHQTRVNTRRNKGNAEYPAQILARHSGEEEGDVDGETSDQQDEAEASKAGRGKSVVWKEPLADYQAEEKPKRGRPVGAAPKGREMKVKAKPVGSSRISKPAPKPSAATQKQRSTRLAAGLGMAGNGTPAPKRVTRASTRTRK